MKRTLLITLLVCLVPAMFSLLPGGGPAFAASAQPYRFHTEWAKLSAVDGRKLTPPVEKNISMAVLWLLPEPGYHTYAHEQGDEGIPLTVSVLADGKLFLPKKSRSTTSGGRFPCLPAEPVISMIRTGTSPSFSFSGKRKSGP